MKTVLVSLFLLQAPQVAPQVAPAAPVQDDYRIGVADVLDVGVFGEPDASRAGVTVDTDGTIDFPYLGRVKVLGQTARQVEGTIHDALVARKYFLNPSVTVAIAKYRSKTVTVQGVGIRNPGEYILQGNVALTSVLAQAGSLTTEAGSYVLISRRDAAGGLEEIRISRRDIETGKAQNVFLKDGDTVLVPKAETFLITGYVRSPQVYTWEEGLTVERALALAGGPTERAAVSRIEIERAANGHTEKTKVKLTDLVMANDTIRVPQRIW